MSPLVSGGDPLSDSISLCLFHSFMGEILPNHAYVDLSLVGNDGSGSDSVQCHTDLSTCCTGAQDEHRGDQIPPGSEDRLLLNFVSGADIYEVHGAQNVNLHQ